LRPFCCLPAAGAHTLHLPLILAFLASLIFGLVLPRSLQRACSGWRASTSFSSRCSCDCLSHRRRRRSSSSSKGELAIAILTVLGFFSGLPFLVFVSVLCVDFVSVLPQPVCFSGSVLLSACMPTLASRCTFCVLSCSLNVLLSISSDACRRIYPLVIPSRALIRSPSAID
jgi:hypothetical protein